MRTDLQELDEVIRETVVRWRTSSQLTHEQASRRFRSIGLDMSRSAVTAFERDGRKFSPGEWVCLCLAIGTTPQAMLAGDETVRLTGTCQAPLKNVRDLLAKRSGRVTAGDLAGFVVTQSLEDFAEDFGARYAELDALARRVGVPLDTPPLRLDEVRDWTKQEVEQRAAKRLGVPVLEVAMASLALWRKSLTDERDRRAGPRMLPGTSERSARMVRAHVTRELENELEHHLQGGE